MATKPKKIKNTNGSFSYEVRYWVPNSNPARQKGKTFPTLREAREYQSIIEAQIAQGAYMDASRGLVPFRELGDKYLEGIVSNSTRAAQRQRLERYVYPIIGDLPVAQIHATEITAVCNSLLHLAVRTQAQIFGVMNSVFARAVDDKRRTDNPCLLRTVTRPATRVRGEQPDAWPREQIQALIANIRPDFRIFVYLGYGCGLRQGEIFGLSPADIQWDAGIIRVQRQVKLVGGHQFFGPLKARVEKPGAQDAHKKPVREVPLPGFARRALKEHLDEYGAKWVTLPWDPGDNTDPGPDRMFELFLSTRESGAMNRNYFNPFIWKPALRAAGIPTTRENGTHALRHYYASKMAPLVGMKRLAVLLGHVDAAFTGEVYSRWDRTRDADTLAAAEALGDVAESAEDPGEFDQFS